MAIKKLVKLDHADPQVNQLQRNIEDVFLSIGVQLSAAVDQIKALQTAVEKLSQ